MKRIWLLPIISKDIPRWYTIFNQGILKW